MTKPSTIEYRGIDGCEGYRVGSDGSIWSCWKFRGGGYGRPGKQLKSDRWRQLKPDRRKEDGRARYTIRRNDGTYRRSYASHFVLENFIGKRPIGMEACHGDGNCLNDSATNLRWGTSTSNKADMVRHGTRQNGEAINTAKLTAIDIAAIRDRRLRGEKLSSIAALFGVSTSLVSAIVNRKAWKHVA